MIDLTESVYYSPSRRNSRSHYNNTSNHHHHSSSTSSQNEEILEDNDDDVYTSPSSSEPLFTFSASSSSTVHKHDKANHRASDDARFITGSSGAEEEYEVEAILDKRKRDGVTEYYLKWKNFSNLYNTWEPEKNVYCFEKIKEFNIKYNQAHSKPNTSKRVKVSQPKNRNISPIQKSNPLSKGKSYPTNKPLNPDYPLKSSGQSLGKPKKAILQSLLTKYQKDAKKNKILESIHNGSRSSNPTRSPSKMTSYMPKNNIPIIVSSNGNLNTGKTAGSSGLLKKKAYDPAIAYANALKFEKYIKSIDTGPPIKVMNEIDNEGAPAHFQYINESFFGPGVPLPDPSFLSGCDCLQGCSNNPECLCMENNELNAPYNEQGLLKLNHGAIYECNLMCKCGPSCPNRVVQNGRKVKLNLIRFDNGKGWGVVADQDIPKGSFICAYIGEIVTNEEADQRAKIYDPCDRAYLFDLDFYYQQGAASDYTIDARQYGNISHFFNHSCEPNIKVYACFIDNLDPRLHINAFFACKDIKKGDEIAFDYLGLRDGEVFDNINSKKATRKPKDFTLPCLCGSARCRKYVYL